MPNKRASQRWEHPTYRYAYVREFRGMACTVIHGSFPQTTGLYWKPASKAQAMKILDQRLQSFLHGSPVIQSDSMTCLQLFEQFAEVRLHKMTKTMQYAYRRYMKNFVPPGVDVNDTVVLRKTIADRIRESTYAQNTKRSAMTRIRTVFQFGIEQGWVKVNPVHPDMIPEQIVAEPQPYTSTDLNNALEKLDGRNRSFVAFLMSTGCRAIEAARLTWDAVHEDHVIIDGKQVRSGRQRLRIIPFFLCPEVREILNQARGQAWSSDDRVFGVKNYQPIARAFNEAMEGDGRGFHDIRKWRINIWVREGWPEKVIEAVAGHDTNTSRKHYRTPYTVIDLARFMQDSSVADDGQIAR